MKAKNMDLWKLFVTDKSFNGEKSTYGTWLEKRVLNLESQLKEVDKVIWELYDEGRIHRKVYLKLKDQIEKYK